MIGSGAGTTKIGPETFALGLFWQAAPSISAAAREARIVAVKAEIAADLIALRRLGQPQFGLGSTRAGHRPKMPSLAAVLANAVETPSWVGVFELDGGDWVYVAVRKGAIMPDGDILFQNEEEARARLREDLSVGGWEEVFAPSSWQVADARGDALADLCGPTRDARLVPVSSSSLRPILLAGAVVFAGTGLWLAFGSGQDAPPPPAVPDVPVAPPPPPPPWEGQPKGMDVVKACQDALTDVRIVPGYDILETQCSGQGATVHYKRTVGTIAWLPEGTTATSPDEAVGSQPVHVSGRPKTPPEEPWPARKVKELLWVSAQTYRITLTLSGSAPPVGILPRHQTPDVPSFDALSFTLSSTLPPTVFTAFLDDVPTLVVDSLAWRTDGWIVKGRIYVR